MARFVIFLSLFFSIACSKPEPPVEAQRYSFGMRRAPDSLNPYVSTRLEGEIISRRLFPQLFRELPPQKSGMPQLEPVLVANHAWSEDQTTLQLELKPGLQWSDGEPLTAEDVAFTLGIQKDPDLAWVSADRKQRLESWQVKDPLNIQVQFSKKSAFNLLDLNEGVILPKHYFSQWAAKDWIEHPWQADLVTYGPYKIGEWTPSERLILESVAPGANPTLGFAFVRDKDALYRLVESGELDYAWGLPVARINDVRKLPKAVTFPDLTFGFIGWNPLAPGAFTEAKPESIEALAALLKEKPHPIFGDVRVRQAMAFAVKRRHHLDKLWSGEGAIPANPWQAGLPYRSAKLAAENYDVEKANTLLNEAGWVLKNGVRQKDGVPFSFSVICNTGSPIREAYLLAVKADLAELGIEMKLAMMEGGLYVQACSERDFDAMFGSFRTGTRPDLGSLYSDDAAVGGFNFCSWIGQSEKLEAVQQAEDDAALDQALASLEAAFQNDHPLLMLYRGMNIAGSSKANLKVQANALDYLFAVEDW